MTERCQLHYYPPHIYALRPFGRMGSIMRCDRDPLPDRCYWHPCTKLARLPGCRGHVSLRTRLLYVTDFLMWTGPGSRAWSGQHAAFFQARAAQLPHRCEPMRTEPMRPVDLGLPLSFWRRELLFRLKQRNLDLAVAWAKRLLYGE